MSNRNQHRKLKTNIQANLNDEETVLYYQAKNKLGTHSTRETIIALINAYLKKVK